MIFHAIKSLETLGICELTNIHQYKTVQCMSMSTILTISLCHTYYKKYSKVTFSIKINEQFANNINRCKKRVKIVLCRKKVTIPFVR